MKNINEKRVDPFWEKAIKESKNVDNPEFKERLKTVCDSLKNCNNKLVYVDGKHWCIQID